MNRGLVVTLAAFFYLLFPSLLPAQSPELSTRDLLLEMRSLAWLANAFSPGTRMVQFSSYDRKSRIVNGDTVEWWANMDWGYYLRKEETKNGTEYVLAEAAGPGAIVRMWSANPGQRTWRIYLDGADTPVLAERGQDLLEGKVPPWGPAFSERRNFGANFIFPLLFQKSVKVTVSGKPQAPPLMYYQVDLRLFPTGTRVRTFFREELSSIKTELDSTAQVLEDPDRHYQVPAGKTEDAEVELAPAAEGELFSLTGPAAIVRLEVEVKGEGEALTEVLGRTLLKIKWDAEPRASVQVPLGDFFGTSPGANAMNSLPMSVQPTPDGARLVCRFVMPFAQSALITLVNQSPKRLFLRAHLATIAWNFGPDSLYFHAGYREWNRMPTRPFHDLRMLAVKGRGHFVGLEMNVRNPMEYFWWGEGDEKVWVDNDQFPSIFGTGTEDYFGYAWCVQYFKFTRAFHGVSLPTREWLAVPQVLQIPWFWEGLSNAAAREAIVSQYRWQILDAVPFENHFRFDMELYHHRNTKVDVNATAYWYAAAGAEDDAVEPDLGKRSGGRP